MTLQSQIQELPEFIQGLATKKSEAKQRREIVKNAYNSLLDKLGKKNGKNKLFVHNDFLNVDVWFVNREGGKETSKKTLSEKLRKLTALPKVFLRNSNRHVKHIAIRTHPKKFF